MLSKEEIEYYFFQAVDELYVNDNVSSWFNADWGFDESIDEEVQLAMEVSQEAVEKNHVKIIKNRLDYYGMTPSGIERYKELIKKFGDTFSPNQRS